MGRDELSQGALAGLRRARATAAAVAAGVLLALLPLIAPAAWAATAATASVDRKISYRGQTYTYSLTVTNTSSAGEALASVAVVAPSSTWSITGCPETPPGWTATVYTGYCIFESSAGAGDDIAAGSSETFKVTAAVAAGDGTETGVVWGAYADITDTFNYIDGYTTVSPAAAGSLAASIYGIQITDVSVRTATSTIGGACPTTNKKAPAGSSRVLVVCGRVFTSNAFTAKDKGSALTGSFVSNDGSVTSASVARGSGQVVLAYFSTVTVTSTVGDGLSVIAKLGNANGSISSPQVTFDGYTTDTTAPVAPSTPDLDDASDTGASSSDNITKDATPSFSGTAEPNSTVELLVGSNVKATTTSTSSGTYSVTVPDSSSLSDGNRSVSARATDPSGNISATSAALSITVDTAVPATPSLDATPSSIGSDESPSWSFNGEAGGRFACSLTDPGAGVTSDGDCTSPKTYDLSRNSDGTYTFTVTVEDVAGNRSPAASQAYTLDREGPAAPTISARPADVVPDPQVEWSFSGEAGGSFECVLVRPDLSEVLDGSCSSPRSYNLSSQADGDYTFKVRQVDGAGHVGPYESDSFVLDRQGPPVPEIVSSPNARSNDTTPTWGFSGEAGGSFECVLVKPGNVQVTTSGCTTPKTYDVASDGDGTYTFKVRQFDGAGNPGDYATSSFALDRAAPSAPSITSRPPNFDDDTEPTWTFEGETNSTFECVLVLPDTTELTSLSCSSPKSFDISSEDDGLYTFKVRQVDGAGNSGPYASDDFTLDRVAPSAPSIDLAPLDLISGSSVQWSFSGEDGATFRCVLVKPDASELIDSSCGSPKAYDIAADADGLFTFKVLQVDRAGHEGAYAVDSFELDRGAPASPTITSAPNPRSNDDTPQWGFSGEIGTTFECVLMKPGNVQIVTPDCAAPQSYDVSADPDGTYTFKVRQFDAVGNASDFVTSSYLLDRAAPSAPAITSQPRNYDDNVTPTWDFSGEFGASFECVLVRPDTTEISDTPCVAPKAFDLTSELDGTYLFKVRQIDAAGNPGPYASDDYTFDRTPPRPILTGDAPDPTNDPIHEWTFTGVEGATFECTVTDPEGVETIEAGCTSPYTLDLTDAPDGTYVFGVRQFLNEDGSVAATDMFTLDRAVSAPAVSVKPGPRGNSPAPVWRFDGEANATFDCILVDAAGEESPEPGCTDPKRLTFEDGSDGIYTLKVRQTDAAGNTSDYTSRPYELDRQAPAAAAFTSSPKRRTRDLTPAWAFTGEPGSTFVCTLRGPGGTTTTDANCSSPQAYVLEKVEGNYVFEVVEVDQAGNEGPVMTSKMMLDLTKPAAKNLRVGPKKFRPTRRSVVKINFRRNEPAKAVVIVKKGRKTIKKFKKTMKKAKVALRWKTVYRKKPVKPGKYKIIVQLRDKVGLKSKVTRKVTAKR